MDWFIFALGAVILFGLQAFLFKVSTQKDCDPYVVTLVFIMTVLILGSTAWILKGFSVSFLQLTLILGSLFALSFYLHTLGLMKALKHLPTNIVYPITGSAIVFTVL